MMEWSDSGDLAASLLIETLSCGDAATQKRWWCHVEASSVGYATGVRWSRENRV